MHPTYVSEIFLGMLVTSPKHLLIQNDNTFK